MRDTLGAFRGVLELELDSRLDLELDLELDLDLDLDLDLELLSGISRRGFIEH